MPRVGQARKRDHNEEPIVKALRKIGVTVWRLNGAGIPDLLTHYRGKWGVIEVKKPRGRLTDAQCNTRALAPFPVVECISDALALFIRDLDVPLACVVDAIRDRGRAVEPVAKTAEDFGVSRSVVRRIQAGKGDG